MMGTNFQLVNNVVNDAFCGIAFVSADNVEAGTFLNTLSMANSKSPLKTSRRRPL